MHDYRNSIFARVLISLRRRRRFLLITFVIVAVVAVGISLILPKSYTTETSFQVKSRQSSLLPDELQGLGMLDPLKQNAGTATVSAIFESRELAMAMIEKFDLMEKYKTEWEHLAIKRFQQSLQVDFYSENIIEMAFTYDSQDSVKIIADSILAYVDAKNRELSVSKASSDYATLSTQMERIQADIVAVADSAAYLLKLHNIADLENQTRVGLELLAGLEEEITQLRTRQAMMETENSGSPVMIEQLRNAVSVLQEKQRRILEGESISMGDTRFSFIAPYGSLPDLQKNFQLFEVEILKNEAFLKMLIPSLQEARTAMVENVPTLTFIDHTYRPPYKSKPKRALVVVLIVFPVMFLLCIFFVLKDFFRDPEYASDPGRNFLRYVKSRS